MPLHLRHMHAAVSCLLQDLLSAKEGLTHCNRADQHVSSRCCQILKAGLTLNCQPYCQYQQLHHNLKCACPIRTRQSECCICTLYNLSPVQCTCRRLGATLVNTVLRSTLPNPSTPTLQPIICSSCITCCYCSKKTCCHSPCCCRAATSYHRCCCCL